MTGPLCAVHPERPASGACEGCGGFHCSDCLSRGVCPECRRGSGGTGRRDLAAEGRIRAVGAWNQAGAVLLSAWALLGRPGRAGPVPVAPLVVAAAIGLALLGTALRFLRPRARPIETAVLGIALVPVLVEVAREPGPRTILAAALVAAIHTLVLWALFSARSSRCFGDEYASLVRRFRKEAPGASPLAWILVAFTAAAGLLLAPWPA